MTILYFAITFVFPLALTDFLKGLMTDMKQIDFENGTITGNIINAAVPMLTAQVLSLLYNIVDRIYIARIPGIGSTALGAVGLCFPVIIIITAFSNLFGGGGAPLFAIQRGMGHDRKAGRIMNTSYTMLCGCAVLVFAEPLLKLFGASEAALVYVCPYMMIYLLGTFPSMATTGLNPFINAQGYATTGMLSITIGAVANLILDPIFIFALHLGIKGAAIATVISQCLSAGFVLYFLMKKAEIRVRLLQHKELPGSWQYAKNIVSLGTSGFVMQLTNSLVSICCNNVLAHTGGDLYVSVMTIISSVRQMVETPILAITDHGNHGIGLFCPDVGIDPDQTAFPDPHFQFRPGALEGCCSRYEAVFRCFYLYGFAIHWTDRFQITE